MKMRRLERLCLATTLTLVCAHKAYLLGQAPQAQPDLRAAASAEKSGRYEEAAALYQRFLSGIESSKTNPSVLVEVRTRLATAYFLLHRYRESLDAVAPLTSKNPGSTALPVQAWLVDGLDRLELGQLPGAIASLRRTLALNPASGTARLALGDAFERSGRLEEAAREYEEQTRRTPAVPDAWYKLGLAYSRLATQVSRVFSQKFPASVIGQQLAAENLLANGDYLGAAPILLRLLTQAPHQPQVHAELGTVLLDQGFPKSARAQFRQELSQDPESPLARLGLGETAALRGDWDQAVSALESLARSQPHELAELLELPPPRLLHEAWMEGKTLPERFTGSPGGLLWKAWLTHSDTRPPVATMSPACNDVPPKAMTTPGLWLPEACYQRLRGRLKARDTLTQRDGIKLAEAEFRLGNHQLAYREAQRVLRSNAQSEWGLYWLGMSNRELAQDCFSKVASMNPESARVHEMLGEYYAGRHNFPHAETEYMAAIRLAPELADLHMGLGTVYWAGGQWTEAEKELERTLELAPGSAVAHYELGDTYVQERRWQSAIDHLKRALADPNLATKVRVDLAQAEDETGETRKAIDELLPVLNDDKEGEIHYRLARLYRKIGDKTREREALDVFRRRRASSPPSDLTSLEALEKQQEAAERTDTLKPPQ